MITFAIGFVTAFDKAYAILGELSEWIEDGVDGVHIDSFVRQSGFESDFSRRSLWDSGLKRRENGVDILKRFDLNALACSLRQFQEFSQIRLGGYY